LHLSLSVFFSNSIVLDHMTSNDVEQDMTSARLLSFEFLPFPGTHKELLLNKLYTYTRGRAEVEW
jgi:hypothetical protein